MKMLSKMIGAAWLLSGSTLLAQESQLAEAEIPAGANYAVAQFRFWHPPAVKILRGVAVLVPGSNADGRAQVQDSVWQDFARRNGLGLLGCTFQDHPHENMNIEDYARASDGSGPALLEALARVARATEHPEVATAPLLLWGHSAGGEFNYEFACWKPERVLAFVVNKGGYYFTHLAPPATRQVPGIFFVGAKDEEYRILSIRGIFAINRQAGAVWQLVTEPGAGHEVGKSRELTIPFFERILADRLDQK
jgi:dienelactone hydrolase